jgi:acyl carrier protein
MGLDTVELAYSLEQYFGCEIPDAVSEKLYTVGDAAFWFSQQLGVAGQRHSAVRAAVAAQLLAELPAGTTEATPLSQALPDTQTLKNYLDALQNRYSLLVPQLTAAPAVPAPPSLWERLTGWQLPKAPHWHTQTLAALIDWTVAINYEKLLLPPLISQYEVEQAVIGLTSDKSGVEVEAIRLDSSFTSDLGMD